MLNMFTTLTAQQQFDLVCGSLLVITLMALAGCLIAAAVKGEI